MKRTAHRLRISRSTQPFAAVFVGLGALLVTSVCPAAKDDPSGYIRKSNWHESLVASIEALSGNKFEDGFAPFESETMRGGEAARRVSIPVAGAQELYLFVTGVPDVKWAVADWADARLVRDDGSSESLAKLDGLTVLLGRSEKNLTLKSGLYQKMRMGGRLPPRIAAVEIAHQRRPEAGRP